MKKLLSLLLLTFGLHGQTLVKLKQVGDGQATGSFVVTGAPNGALTTTPQALFVTTAQATSSYVPYSGATTSVNLAANSLSVGAIKMATVAIASPSNGYFWYDPTLNAFTFYQNSNGSNYTAVFTNSVFSLGVYNVATTASGYNCQLVTTNTTGIAMSPNGNIVLGVATESVNARKRVIIGGTVDSPSYSLTVAGNVSVTSAVTTPTVYGGSTGGSTLNLMGSSSSTPGVVSAGSSTASSFIARGTSTFVGGSTFQSTVTIGNTSTLTGGNAGTVAVLSDAVFPVTFHAINFNLVDAQTYYFGNQVYGGNNFAAGMGTITIPYNSTLVGWDFNGYVSGTVGSAESATLQIAGTTTLNLNSAISLSVASGQNPYTATGLSNNFNAGDRINIKFICPTYATNPTGLYFGLTLWFVRRK